ncbi:protein of unknown function [Taphrina deformans PYCC 5710]|uniref:Major facilitator superfamily (MFS) profile domain-containing protein n=1 Tax=Taphrina deformans (strain PYCC 5710 / ATCC 11124 / CBS 356.35 / IMI 108563 / JCM 9778 / NBRC 8474) TaxID=1097556 RepID=R4XF54_TAPDE|nr:protein of unknown function [Taphrina deformans PYCC 5710]|eukprot:CCG84278.1 protein of unknown function [Taphrina deformans PYCC 5710]
MVADYEHPVTDRPTEALLVQHSRPSLSAARKSVSFSEERRSRDYSKRKRTKHGRQTLGLDPTDIESEALLGRASEDTEGDSDAQSSDTIDTGPKSAYERKIDLVTQEIDNLGFGRYQWGLFIVCGSGWLLDLLWAHAFGLAMPAIQHELGISERQYGYLSTGFSLGMTLGALTWGILLDTLGRRAAFNYTVAISSVFGICTGFVNSYALLVFLASGVGFGVGGNIPVDTTIFLEFIPQKDRAMLVVMSIFQPIGSILSTLIAWALIPRFSCPPKLPSCRTILRPEETTCCSRQLNYGWRYMFFTISAITLFIFGIRFIAFTMLESPAFLLSHGRDEEAVEVLHTIAKRNETVTRLTIEHITAQNERDATPSSSANGPPDRGFIALMQSKLTKFDIGHLTLLFKNTTTTRLTILTWLIYSADFWGFTLAGVFLPKILLQKGAIQHVAVTETYKQYIYIAMAGIPGALLSMLIIQKGIGRRITMIASSAMMAASLFLFATVSSKTGNLLFNCLEYFSQTIFNAILYAWTPEVFEPGVRGSATGIASFWGRSVSIIAPLLGSMIFASSGGGNKVLFAAGGGTLVATLCLVLLP